MEGYPAMSIPEDSGGVASSGPIVADQRIALCLSGGGFRAAIFHLGALRRLNELRILSTIDTVASVSGGSILAAHLASRIRPWPKPGTQFNAWQQNVEIPFQDFVKTNIRTGPVLKRLLPWNWFRPSAVVRALEETYRKRLSDLKLADLPDRPTFVFCATDMVFGVSWVFERRRVGSYLAGYVVPTGDWPLAKAVAASSCFPPVFSPLPIKVNQGQQVAYGTALSIPSWTGMSVSDGGLYDNLGLQPVERHGTVLVSDGGQPFVPAVPKGMLGRAKAYLGVMGKQVGAVRKRLLVGQFRDKVRRGTYWGIGSAVQSYRRDVQPGYTKGFAAEVIAAIRTDLDAFSEAEIAVLMNHGYLLADIAIQTHASHLVPSPPEKRAPYPDWLDERRAREALKDSYKRSWWGRS